MIPMAYHFSLHPWDIDRLVISDFEVYRAGLEEMARQNKSGEDEAKRPTRRR